MLPNSRVVKLLSGIFGAAPSFCLSMPIAVFLLFVVTDVFTDNCEPTDDSCFSFGLSSVVFALFALYGTVALWMVLFDENTISRFKRIVTALGLVVGIAAATLGLIDFSTSGFGLSVFTLSLLSCLSVGSYHLIRLVQFEWRSRNLCKT